MRSTGEGQGRSLVEQIVAGVSTRNDFPLVASKCALLVIDIQEYLSKPTNPEEEEWYIFFDALPRATKNISELIQCCRRLRDGEQRQHHRGCEVIFTYLESLTKDCRDVSIDYKLSGKRLANLPNESTAPATFLPAISPSTEGKGDIKIPKTSCNVFCSTNIAYVLRNLGVEQLIVTGQLTDQCVESAVRGAADRGFLVTVAKDACAATSAESHEKGLHGMSGFCRVLSTKEILEELKVSAS